MDAVCWRYQWECTFTVTIALIVASRAELCSRIPWNTTVCCTGGAPRYEGEVRMGAEDTLSVTECVLLSNGTNVTLAWNYDRHATIDGNSLERIFIFSHCINPTNTSQEPTLSTLLYDSNRHHRTSSITTLQPHNAVCNYFGCYGAFHGLLYYTFSEVSCTQPTSAVVPTVTYSNTILTTTLETNYAITSTSVHSTQHTRLFHGTIYHTEHYNAEETQSPLSSKSAQTGTHTGFWVWLLAFLVTSLSIVAATTLCLLITRYCTGRNTPSDIKTANWKWHLSTTNVVTFEKDGTFHVLDTLSLHSEHTVYEEIIHSSTTENKVDG